MPIVDVLLEASDVAEPPESVFVPPTFAPAPDGQPAAAQPSLAAPRRRLPGGRAARFVVEAAFLVAVALVAWQAELRPALIAGAMAVAWVVVALVEWVASRGEARRT